MEDKYILDCLHLYLFINILSSLESCCDWLKFLYSYTILILRWKDKNKDEKLIETHPLLDYINILIVSMIFQTNIIFIP